MNTQVLATVVVAALVSAVTAAGTGYLLFGEAGPLQRAATETTSEQGRVEQIVRDYLTKNPEILVDMTTELDKRQQAEETAKQQKTISDNAEVIFRSPVSHVAGNPDGDVSVVEFFDYNCGYCRRALPDVVKLIKEDRQIRFVLKELPIFGEESEDAAKLALAADKQGKYFEMHQKLLADPGKANKEKALRIARELDLDIEKLEKDMKDPAVTQALEESKDLAEKLRLQGTPLYLIGDRVIPGAPDDLYDQLREKVAEVRSKGCASTC